MQKEKLTASSEKNCSVSILGADFWSDSRPSLQGREARSVFTDGFFMAERPVVIFHFTDDQHMDAV